MDFLETFSTQATFINTSVVPWVLRVVMVGLGLSLTVADFKRVVVFPKAVSIGLIAQIVGQPVLGFTLALIFGVSPAIAMGLVILAACPSGVTSNAYTFAARADVPLCVTLSALTSSRRSLRFLSSSTSASERSISAARSRICLRFRRCCSWSASRSCRWALA